MAKKKKRTSMVKFSDIFDKDGKDKKEKQGAGEAKEKQKEKESNSSPINFSAVFNNEREPVPGEKKEEKKEQVDFSSLINPSDSDPDKKNNKPNDAYSALNPSGTQDGASPSGQWDKPMADDEIEDVYKKAVTLAEGLFNSETGLNAQQVKEIRGLVEKLIYCIQHDGQIFFEYIFKHLADDVNFISLHLVNVCILALEIGVGMNYQQEELLKLGLAAFLNDIGLKNYKELVLQKRKLTLSERQKIQQYTLQGLDILKQSNDDIDRSVREIIAQKHERIDGTGYPQGLKENQINELAQIIGLVDVYEALTHKRPYRGKYTPVEAIKIIFESKAGFSPQLTKIFLERVGIYPKGTFVELNTKEIAEVLRQNTLMPSCPVVAVIYDQYGKKIDYAREIDLSRGTNIYITKSL